MSGVRLGWDEAKHDIPLQNVQPRLGFIDLDGCKHPQCASHIDINKSEAAVGYATMDGDTSGGLSPIADVPKSDGVWLTWACRFHGFKSVDSVIATPATTELRPKEYMQTDEDDLMPFFIWISSWIGCSIWS